MKNLFELLFICALSIGNIASICDKGMHCSLQKPKEGSPLFAMFNNPSNLCFEPCLNEFDDPNYNPATNFTMEKYFSHLEEYSPNNNYDSCGFVSLIQVMSFYDTFYNDYIIDEFFDEYDSNITTFYQAYQKAPGVHKSIFTFSDPNLTVQQKKQEYYSFCHNHMFDDFLSYMVCLYNIVFLTDNQYAFEPSITCSEYQTLLTSYFSSSTDCVVWTSTGASQSSFISSIKSFINVGQPVIVHIQRVGDNNTIYRHSVVAYKYDDDNIYANFGWGPGTMSYPLVNCSQHSYTDIYYIAVLNFNNMGHYHSDNYLVNGVGYCGCNPYNNF